MTENMKSLAKNSLFNAMYQVLNIIFPLISSIYVARVLLPEGVGRVAYAQNIAAYFVTAAALGIPTVGLREISNARDDKQKVSNIFSELSIMNICSTFLAIAVYSILVFCNSAFRADYQLYLATGLVILFNIINIDWLYQGHEEYVYIVVRSIAVKALSLLALFLFVRNKYDYVAYAAISSLAVCGNYLFNVVRARKYVTFQLHGLNFKRHIKPIFFFAGTLFFNAIYSKTDATMLGIIVGEESVGYYSYAHKVLQVGISFCAAVTSAFLPRLSYYFQKDKNQFYTLVARGVQIISTGLFLLAPEAIVMLFGDKFLPAAQTLRIFAVLIIVFAFGNLLCYQMMICTENEKKYAGILACAAVINVVLNFVLIPKYQQDGAALASVLTELFINIVVGMYFVRLLRIKFDWRAIGQAMFSSGIMAISIILVKKYVKGNLLSFVCSVSIGTVIYVVMNLLLKNQLVRDAVRIIRRKLLR